MGWMGWRCEVESCELFELKGVRLRVQGFVWFASRIWLVHTCMTVCPLLRSVSDAKRQDFGLVWQSKCQQLPAFIAIDMS